MSSEAITFLSGFAAGTINYWIHSRYGHIIDAAAFRLVDWITSRGSK